jgi:hypothetical protein
VLREVDPPEGGGQVEDDVDPGDRAVDERAVRDAAERDLGAEPLELVVEEPGRIVQNAHAIASREQAANEVASGEPGATGDEREHAPSIAGARRQTPRRRPVGAARTARPRPSRRRRSGGTTATPHSPP